MILGILLLGLLLGSTIFSQHTYSFNAVFFVKGGVLFYRIKNIFSSFEMPVTIPITTGYFLMQKWDNSGHSWQFNNRCLGGYRPFLSVLGQIMIFLCLYVK